MRFYGSGDASAEASECTPPSSSPPSATSAPRHPEYLHHEPWELAHVLFSLGYVEDLAGEPKIDAAVEVVRQDWPLWRSAA